MLNFFMAMGPSGPVMAVIAIIILVLATVKTVQLSGAAADRATLERGLDAVLFWGAFCAVLGFLGQVLGHYKSLNVIIHAERIDPRLVFMGMAEALTSTIAGMTILLVSSLVWFALRTLVRRRLGRAS